MSAATATQNKSPKDEYEKSTADHGVLIPKKDMTSGPNVSLSSNTGTVIKPQLTKKSETLLETKYPASGKHDVVQETTLLASEKQDAVSSILRPPYNLSNHTQVQSTQASLLIPTPSSSVTLTADYVGGIVLSSNASALNNARDTILNTAPIASNVLQNSLSGQGKMMAFTNSSFQFGSGMVSSIPSQYLQGQTQVMSLMNLPMVHGQQQLTFTSSPIQPTFTNLTGPQLFYPSFQNPAIIQAVRQVNLTATQSPLIGTVTASHSMTEVYPEAIRPAMATLSPKQAPVITIRPSISLDSKISSSKEKPLSHPNTQNSINDIQLVSSNRMEKMHSYLRKQALATKKKTIPQNMSMLHQTLKGKIMLDADNNGVVIGKINPKLQNKKFLQLNKEGKLSGMKERMNLKVTGRKKKLVKRKYEKKKKVVDAIAQPHATDKYSHPIIHPQKEVTSLPVAAAEEEVRDIPLTSMDDPDSGSGAGSKVNLGHLEYEITSDDGFSCRSDSLDGAWKQVFEKVQDMRTASRMKQLSYAGLSGGHMFGLTHEAVVYLVEQLYGANYCRRYKFKYHKHALAEQELELVNPSGCIRTEPFSGRNPWDMFSFLMSRYRKLPVREDKVNNEEMIQKSSRRATSMDLPMAMRFRKLKEHSREAVGVYRSTIHGRGLFCKRKIDAGEMIIEYAGEVIRNCMTDQREKYYESRGIGCYMFRIDDMEVVDATMKGSAARFINHSCEPNCYSKVITVDNRKHIVIFAIRQIMQGEELTYDYKFPIEEVKILCTCGSKKCRKYLN